jgi:hypothetical protein
MNGRCVKKVEKVIEDAARMGWRVSLESELRAQRFLAPAFLASPANAHVFLSSTRQ